ncbi:MAG: hypothetical protein L6416_09550 [Candidatus Omnitrophica bacterium]|nr:hypothetical protein [Candidatus Omnitrophota bacterium]
MMDKEKFIFLIKCLAALVIIIFFFTVIVPKYKQLNDFITARTEEFLSLIFQTTVSLGKKTNEYQENYIKDEFASFVASFGREFLTFSTNDQLKKLIIKGESILGMAPLNINIRQKTAFLLYMDGQFEKAIENYEFVLDNIPRRKRTFKKLSQHTDYRSIKRVLLELAALYYDLDKKEKMINYYKQFLRTAFRDEIYRHHISGGITEKKADYGIFANFGGAGLFSYKKSIKELEKYLKAYPEEKDVILILAKNNYEVVNLFFDFAPDDYLDYVNNAQKYLELSLDFAPEQRKAAINNDLSQLQKLKDKYLERKQSVESEK